MDRAYGKSLKVMEINLEGNVVTVLSDGWTKVCGRAVLNYMATCGDLCYFLELWCSGISQNLVEADRHSHTAPRHRLTEGSPR
ncbi:hypothetical protein PC114_g12163 [Phytophthora cactorum]|nr:hypothetical protein PC114_g12163 [Phytophthora cactorum]